MFTKLEIEMLIFEFKFILIIYCSTYKITRSYLFNLKQIYSQPFINICLLFYLF